MTSTAWLAWHRVDALAPTAAWSVLHPGHLDPVSNDPMTSFALRLVLAAVVGLLAGATVWVPARQLWHGDVVPVLLVSAVTGQSIVEVENWKAFAAIAILGGILATLGMGIGLLVFDTALGLGFEGRAFDLGGRTVNLATIYLGGSDTTAAVVLQTVLAGVLAAVALYLGTAYGLLPRFAEDFSSLSAVRKHWAVCVATYLVVFVVVRIAAFTVLYG